MMKNVLKKLTIAGLSVSILTASVMPSQAMPRVSAPQVEKQVVEVQYRDDRYWDRRGDRWDRRYDRRDRWDDRYDRRHRSHNNAWVPLAAGALIAGALIAGSAASQPRYAPAPSRAGINPRHYEWCSARYRSYDSYSNTFQPYCGPRQQCLSPYY
jgi:BA14K-like protein